MSARSRILVIDDHAIFRQGLVQVIASDPELEVVGEAGDSAAALDLAATLAPEVVVMDLDLPGRGGLELIERLRRLAPPPAVLVVTMEGEDQMVNAALDRGALGYLTKDNAADDLGKALRTVLRGQVFVTPGLAGALVRRAEALRDKALDWAHLTPSELRVLKLVARHESSQQIARHLFISIRTVEGHRASICAKLGLEGTQALPRFAQEHREEL